MPLTPGTTLGPYQVAAKIGEGGMGEVYQARDTKLDRDVALKVLPEAFTSDPDRLARFEREAKVLASLNHPNIGTIYGLEEAEGVKALVLELVEGPTLADRIRQGPIPVDEALPIAKQIAEALEAAHEQGVIHRDLKPANIKVKADGTVKVLDFGLAKAFQPDAGSDPADSPTVTAATLQGVILGTAAYMSPEQASGKTVDKRSDIWSFGAVLFEMLSGTRPFQGETVAHVVAGVLNTEPDWGALPSETPAAVHKLLTRCLAKEARRRVPDIGMARFEIDDAITAPSTEGANVLAAAPLRVWQRPMPLAAGMLALLIITGIAVWSLVRPAPEHLMRFTIGSGDRLAGSSPDVAISPDGQLFAYFTGRRPDQQLRLRSLDQLTPTVLVAEGGAHYPFFSPDSEWLGFLSESRTETMLKRVSVDGGPAVDICPLPGNMRGATWGVDDTIIFGTTATDSGLWRVGVGGGELEQLTTPDERGNHYWPQILPGGEAVLFSIMPNGPPENAQLAVLSLADLEIKVLLSTDGGYPRYAPTGHIVYAAVLGTLRAVNFDLDRLEVTGDPIPVLDGVLTKREGGANFDVAQNGSLMYMAIPAGLPRLPTPESTLAWVYRDGREEAITTVPPGVYRAPRLSPDGNRVAVTVSGANWDVWVFDLASGAQTRLTRDPGQDRFPLWHPDGERIAFSSTRGPQTEVFLQPVGGTDQPELVASDPASNLLPGSFTPDGRSLLLTAQALVGTGGENDIAMVTLDSDGAPQPVLNDAFFGEFRPRVSPDGRWMAFGSDATGQLEIYVGPYPDVASFQVKVTTDGGTNPMWCCSGDELLFGVARGGGATTIMGVTVETEPALRVGAPETRFEGNFGDDWDIHPDGQRLLAVKRLIGRPVPTTRDIVGVLNWHNELLARVPVP